MADTKALIPNMDKMKSHKCLHCSQEVLSIPGELHILFCQNGFSHTDNEPSSLMGWPRELKQSATFFNYNGTESRKGWIIFDE